MNPVMARGDVEAFAGRLERLKEEGSLLLLVGGDAGARSAVSGRLLGDPDAGRIPVFALLGRDRSVAAERVPAGQSLDEAQVVAFEFDRSVAVAKPREHPRPTSSLTDLDDLLAALRRSIETAGRGSEGPFAPGDLRLCLDALTPVVDGFERRRVESFLVDLRDLVTSRGGMAHAVLPLSTLPARYAWLEGWFDVVVDTRSVDGDPQERWRLPGEDLATAWFRVDEREDA